MRKARYLPLIYFLFSSNSFFFLFSLFFLLFYFTPAFLYVSFILFSFPYSLLTHFLFFFNLFLLWSSLKWLFERNEKSKDCNTVRSFHRFLDKEKRTRKKKKRNAPYSTNLTHPFGGRVNAATFHFSILAFSISVSSFYRASLALHFPSFVSVEILYFFTRKYGHEFAHPSLTTWIFSSTKIDKRYLLYRFLLRKIQTEHQYQEINEEWANRSPIIRCCVI